MKACDAATQRLQRNRDGELPAGERALLDAHLAVCAECRIAADRAGRVDRLLGEALALPPAADLRGDFDARFWSYARRERAASAPRRWGFLGRGWRPIAAGALLLLVGVVATRWERPSPPYAAVAPDSLFSVSVSVTRREMEKRRADASAKKMLKSLL